MIIKSRYFGLLLLAVTMAAGCTRPGGSSSEQSKVRHFDKNSFSNTRLLPCDTIPFQKALNPMLFEVFRDSIIMVRHWQGDPHFFEFHFLKEDRPSFGFLQRGRGSGEWLSAMISYNNSLDESFVVSDIQTRQAAVFYLDSILLLGNDYQPEKFAIPDFAGNDIALLNDGKALVFNKHHINDPQFGNDTETCLYTFEKNAEPWTGFGEESNKHKNFTHNVAGGYLAVSADKNTVMVFYRQENRIEIFDGQLELQQVLLGPDKLEPQYYFKDLGYNHVSAKVRVSSFGRVYYNQNHLYVIYYGAVDGQPAGSAEILKLSWEGDLLERFVLSEDPGMIIRSLYVDPAERFIYATLSREGENPELVRFNLR